MVRPYRFKKRDSARSGFAYLERTLVRDEGSLVGADEFDEPPPSTKSLGAEGDISRGDTRSDYTNYVATSGKDIIVRYLVASDQIPFVTGQDTSGESNTNAQWVFISGSNQAITLSSNPQVVPGFQNAQLTIQCAGSDVTLVDSSGLDLTSRYVMTSGAILNLFYSATDNLWHETSRSHVLGGS